MTNKGYVALFSGLAVIWLTTAWVVADSLQVL